MPQKELFKRLKRIPEITGMMTILLLGAIAGEFFQLTPAATLPLEPVVAGIVAVAAMYAVMLLIEIRW